jgi:hypothetical protein
MVKPSKQIIIDEIISQIEQGKTKVKILAKFGGKWRIASRTYDRYWKNAQEQHNAKQEAIKKELEEIDKQAAIEARKKAIMTAEERKEYLTRIINGEIEVPYTEVKYNAGLKMFETFEFMELASHTARINAIAELNKMEGDYAPTKVDNTHTGSVQIIKLPDNGRGN